MSTDPIAEFCTRIRNAQKARHTNVDIPSSKTKHRLAEILKAEGFITDFRPLVDQGRKILRVQLRYAAQGEPMIQKIKRISKPGCRIYSPAREVPVASNGITVTIVSTSKGMMVGRAAREANLGGELVCSVM
jgi:small subunit ribosomal protein S8